MRPEQIPYGVKDFKRIRLENRYYVDKTAYIRELEKRAGFLFFVRPRRFGKTLLCETLRCYYDVAEKENFDKLFGGLEIGKSPTELANRFLVLSLDFSQVNTCLGSTWPEKSAVVAAAHDQLRRYAADPRIPQLSGCTPVHFIDLEFVGREMRVCEEVVFS